MVQYVLVLTVLFAVAQYALTHYAARSSGFEFEHNSAISFQPAHTDRVLWAVRYIRRC